MSLTVADGKTFGLLPEPEFEIKSLATSAAINLTIVGLLFLIGMTATHVIQRHYEQVELIAPSAAPPDLPKPKPIVLPNLPPPPVAPKVALDMPKIDLPKPKPEPKPIEMEAKVDLPVIKPKEQQVTLAPQPKAALAAAMPAQTPDIKASTAAVHLGDTFGVTPNPNANKPAQVAAIGNMYGNQQGPAVAPHGVVGSAGIPAANSAAQGSYGKVASAGIPAVAAAAPMQQAAVQSLDTSIEVLSKPPVQYTAEARQLKIEGDVVLSVTFTANGQVQVQGVVQGLGHGLDEEARRVAEQIRFRPATRNGHPVDLTTKIHITFQLA